MVLLGATIAAIVVVNSAQWILIPGLALLAAIWVFTTRGDEVPMVAVALSYQWLQVMAAPLYQSISGRAIEDLGWWPAWPRMALLGLASIAVMGLGYKAFWRPPKERVDTTSAGRSTRAALVGYVAAVVLSSLAATMASKYGTLTQVTVALGLVRYVSLFILLRSLLFPRQRWWMITALGLFECSAGFTGYFAHFRIPLAIMFIGFISFRNGRRAAPFVAPLLLAVFAFGAGVTWTAVKGKLREQYSSTQSATDRLITAAGLVRPALTDSKRGVIRQVDEMVSRLWVISYPTPTLARVPAIIPHENGRLLWSAVKNILNPRYFFPEKGEIRSDSDKVVRYSGVRVAGREASTSIAFGYVAESYVDFGIPVMFIPIFLYGALVAFGDRFLSRLFVSREIAQGARVVFVWTSLSLYESAWTIVFGLSIAAWAGAVVTGKAYERVVRFGSNSHEPPIARS